MRGLVPPLRVLTPRSMILTGSPGFPLAEEMLAPGILPMRAWSMEAVGAGGSLSAVTDSMAMPSFFFDVATPTPVTTTSLRDLESVLSTMVRAPSVAFISLFSYPMALMISVALGGVFRVKAPWASALVPEDDRLLLILIVAFGIAVPVGSVIFPETTVVWANSPPLMSIRVPTSKQ